MKYEFNLSLLILAISDWTRGTYGYSKGSPNNESICISMLPGHGVDPLTTLPPYQIGISEYEVGGPAFIRITLAAPPGQFFKGFLAIVKKLGDPEAPVGHFMSISADVQTIDCLNGTGNAATHTSSDPKNSVDFLWRAPNDRNYDNLELVVTFVREWNEIWQAVRHPRLISAKQEMGVEERRILEEAYGRCGSGSKGCFGSPVGCIRNYLATRDELLPQSCDLMVSWQLGNYGRLRNGFSLVGYPTGRRNSSVGYLALALSNSPLAEKGSVVGCYQSPANAIPSMRRYFKDGSNITAYKQDPLLGLRFESLTSSGALLSCKFEQIDHRINDVSINFHETKAFLGLLRGSVGTSDGLYESEGDTAEIMSHPFLIQDTGIF